MEPRAHAIAELLNEGCEVEFFTGFASDNGQGGAVLNAAILGRIAALGADLSLDLYPPTD